MSIQMLVIFFDNIVYLLNLEKFIPIKISLISQFHFQTEKPKCVKMFKHMIHIYYTLFVNKPNFVFHFMTIQLLR